ncbi:FHA domain-containing protein [uncultured Microbacterium sp.]|uniref:FHA domain-containing protein n=1 Tax=uncultured Microbacterium sp. TaxID=191216 RepID=UPI0026182EB4|nr:FHA domain-containing protein [uncultured Microbacterium sp.]
MRADKEAMEKDLSRRPADATTTHARWGAGDPRLLVSQEDVREVFPLTADQVRFGSAPDSELLLAGADPLHATITHDDRDEFVLEMHGEGEMNAGTDDRSETLRTGARFTVAGWTLVFVREEFADHGRPYGGREGGELSDQPAQPQRPDYPAQRAGGPDATATDGREWEVRNG